MHPLWQARQPVRFDGLLHIDRNAVFGNRASGKLWCTFFALVGWAAVHERGVEDLHQYVDDNFGFDFDRQLVYNPPYETSYPAKQVRLLELWDEIGLLHEKPKQVFGAVVEIIGLEVSLISMTISMSLDKRLELVTAIRNFVSPDSPRAPPLGDWLLMLGWMNWALNAYPLLKPALQPAYEKVRGKSASHAPVYRNKDVISHFTWFANHVEKLPGVHFIEMTEWAADDADLQVFCDASSLALGFWCPQHHTGFVSPLLGDSRTIFYNEALCVVSALRWGIRLFPRPRKIAIHTDSLNTVQIFSTLKAEHEYNPLLMYATSLLMDHNVHLRVFFIPGEENVVADALSRLLPNVALSISPGLEITMFTPPRNELGAMSR
jgi:hypothetical protein